MDSSKKTAVLLISMGGPENRKQVFPFLFRLFCDKDILRLPAVLRWPLALILALSRQRGAVRAYGRIGGRSPLYENSFTQAKALEAALNEEDRHYRCFLGMLYAPPFVKKIVRDIKYFQPDQLILLPLYPQYSSTTTLPALKQARLRIKKEKMTCSIIEIDGFCTDEGFVHAQVELIKKAIEEVTPYGPPRLLFSAHGLPEAIVNKGDPYPMQCAQTVRALMQHLPPETDFVICYQSRVGPVRWLEPSTDKEIVRAAKEKRPIIVVPIAFVCEHVETLVELHQEGKKLSCGAPYYAVVPTVGTHPLFIQGLAQRIKEINQNEDK